MAERLASRQLLDALEWAHEAVAFSGPTVQLQRNCIALGLGQAFHTVAFGKVLPDQTIGVLVGATFPGVVRRSEVDRDVGSVFDVAIGMKLRAIVRGDRPEPTGVSPHQFQGSLVESCHRVVRHPSNQNEAAGALGQRYDAVRAELAVHGIDLPVPELPSALHGGWPFGDMSFARKVSTLLVAPVALSPLRGLTRAPADANRRTGVLGATVSRAVRAAELGSVSPTDGVRHSAVSQFDRWDICSRLNNFDLINTWGL